MVLKLTCTLFLILQILAPGKSQNGSFTLDKLSDWTENGPWFPGSDSSESCFYNNYATDFHFAWGCGGPEKEPVEHTEGFWTACKVLSCHVSFYLDGFLPGFVLVKGLIAGDAMISVRVKMNPNDTVSYLVHDVTVADGNGVQFQGELEIDLSGFEEAKVVEVRIHSANGDGYAILDRLVVREAPTVSPPDPNEASTKISSVVSIIMVLGLAHFIK